MEHAAAVGEEDVVLHDGGRAHLERLRRPLTPAQRDVVGLLADHFVMAPRAPNELAGSSTGSRGSAPGTRGRGRGCDIYGGENGGRVA